MAKNLKLKLARVELDLTQGQLAEAVGVTRQTIGLIEAGKYNPSLSLCQSICRCLGKTLDQLFGRKKMVNKFIHYQLLDEREEQLINKAGAESFSLFIGLVLLSYLVAVLAPSLFNPNFLVYTLIVGIFFFSIVPLSGSDLL